MRKSKRSRGRKGSSLPMMLVAVGAAVGVYLWVSKASAAALPSSGTQWSQQAYDLAKSQVMQMVMLDSQAGGAIPSTSAQVDTLTQAYLRGDATELSGLVTYLRGQGATNTASLMQARLDQVRPK